MLPLWKDEKQKLFQMVNEIELLLLLLLQKMEILLLEHQQKDKLLQIHLELYILPKDLFEENLMK